MRHNVLHIHPNCLRSRLAFSRSTIIIKYWPRKEITEFEVALLSRESTMKRAPAQEERFLANVLRHLKRLYRRIAGKK